jgi:hypothetical protein
LPVGAIQQEFEMWKVCSLAAVSLVGGAVLAAAQGQDFAKPGGAHGGPPGPRGGGPSAGPRPGPQHSAPAPRAAPQPPGAAPQHSAPPGPAARVPQGPSAGPSQAERHRAIQNRAAQEGRANERQRAAGQRALEQQRRAAEQQQRNRAAEQQRANQRRQAIEKQRTEERQAGERHRAAEQQRAAEQKRATEQRAGEERRAAERRRAGEQGKAYSDRPGAGQRASARHEQLRQERAKLTNDQRVRLRRSFTVNRERTTRVHFTRHIGTRIPRSVRLFVIPAAVLAIFPYYRDYRYVVEDDVICVVDPETYDIVDILEEGPYAPGVPPQIAELTLSDRERRLVLDSIPPDFPRANLRLRLALGAEIAPNVQVYEFAPLVLDQVPKLRSFRFVLTEDELVIVAPQDRSIALVLER